MTRWQAQWGRASGGGAKPAMIAAQLGAGADDRHGGFTVWRRRGPASTRRSRRLRHQQRCAGVRLLLHRSGSANVATLRSSAVSGRAAIANARVARRTLRSGRRTLWGSMHRCLRGQSAPAHRVVAAAPRSGKHSRPVRAPRSGRSGSHQTKPTNVARVRWRPRRARGRRRVAAERRCAVGSAAAPNSRAVFRPRDARRRSLRQARPPPARAGAARLRRHRRRAPTARHRRARTRRSTLRGHCAAACRSPGDAQACRARCESSRPAAPSARGLHHAQPGVMEHLVGLRVRRPAEQATHEPVKPRLVPQAELLERARFAGGLGAHQRVVGVF